MVNEHFVEDMKKIGKWDQRMIDELKRHDGNVMAINSIEIPHEIREKYKTAFQQDQFQMINSAAARQRWIDQGQSLNLYNDKTSLKHLNDIYMHAWNVGLSLIHI